MRIEDQHVILTYEEQMPVYHSSEGRERGKQYAQALQQVGEVFLSIRIVVEKMAQAPGVL